MDDFYMPPPRHGDPTPRFQENQRRHAEIDEGDEKIGACYEPGGYETTTGIPLPEMPNNFHIGPHLLAMIKEATFEGRTEEKALDHLTTFHRLCSSYQTSGAKVETVKLLLFPLSLKGAAKDWLKSTPSSALTTWENVEKEFLSMFFPRHLTAKLRSEITNFRQREDENLDKAWERYRNLTTDCPHHGFRKSIILGTFYRGCNPDYRRLIDSSSKGSFSCLNVHEGEKLINTMAKNDRDNQDWSRRPTTPCGMMSLQDITNALRQDDADQKDAYFCGTGNPHNDGSGQILRDMGWEDNGDANPCELNEESPNQQSEQQEEPPCNSNFNNNSQGEYENSPQQVDEWRCYEEPSCNCDFKDESLEEIKSMLAKYIAWFNGLNSKVEEITTHLENLSAQLSTMVSSKEIDENEEEVVVPIDIVDGVQVRGICSSNGKTREVEMLDEVKLSSNGKTRESEALTKKVVFSDGKSRTTTGCGTSETEFSRLAVPPPPITPLLSPNNNKERIMEEAQARVLSAIEIMKSSEESEFLLENDDKFKSQFEILMMTKDKLEKNDLKKDGQHETRFERRKRWQQEARRRKRMNKSKEMEGAGPNNDQSMSRFKNDNGFATREDMVNKLDNGSGRKPPDDPDKDLGKSLRTSRKKNKKDHPKCSKVKNVKDEESNQARLKKDKSGGEPTSKNKRLMLGWDPPVVPSS